MIGGELGGGRPVVERRGVDAAQRLGDGGGDRGIGAAGQQFGLPQRVILGRQVFAQRDAVRPVLADHFGRGARDDGVGAAQPGHFVLVALERRLPVGGHLELTEGPLGTVLPTIGEANTHNIGGNAAGQRGDLQCSTGIDAGGRKDRRKQCFPGQVIHSAGPLAGPGMVPHGWNGTTTEG